MNATTQGVVWQRGKFQKFYAQMKIRVGGASVPVDILAGDEFLFDGTVLKYGGGEYTSPQTRGAIGAGWATLNRNGGGVVQNHSHNRQVAKATSVNRDLSRVQRMGSEEMETDNSDEDTVMNVGDRRPQNTGQRVLGVPNDKAAPRVMTANTVRGMRIDNDEIEAQEGVSVGRVRTPTKVKADLTTSAGQQVASRLENISGSGLIPQGRQQARGNNVLHSEGITVKTSVSGGRVGSVHMSDMDEGEVVGRVRQSKPTSREGITVTDTSNIRDKRAAAERPAKPAAKPAAKSKAAAAPAETSNAAKIKTAKTIDPNFPEDWNFFAKLDERVKLIKKGEKNRKFLQALFVVEGAAVRAHLTKAYPKMFG